MKNVVERVVTLLLTFTLVMEVLEILMEILVREVGDLQERLVEIMALVV